MSFAVGRVLGHADRDERVRDLQQHRRSAAQERRDGRVPDAADDAAGREVPVPARDPLGMTHVVPRAASRPGTSVCARRGSAGIVMIAGAPE